MLKTDEYLISVIIPVYNTGDKLTKCIDSLAKQTIQNFEIIIIDDGSEEYTKLLCDDIRETNKNVKVIHKQNEGPSIARHAGLSESRGNIISFIDADDYVEYDFLETLLNALIENESDIVQAGVYMDYEDQEFKNSIDKFPYLKICEQPNISIFFAEHKNCTDYLCNKIYKKELFEDITFPYLSRGEDRCILTQLYGKAQTIVNIEYIGYHYVQHHNSLSHGGLKKNEYDIFGTTDFIETFFKKHYPSLCEYNHAFHCSQAAQLYFKANTSSQKKELLEKFEMYNIESMKFVSKNQEYLIKLFKLSPSIAKIVYKIIAR